MPNSLTILGIRGVPAAHGGFETFAEALALYLVAQDWSVTVYCQHEGDGPLWEDDWRGIHRINIPVAGNSAKSTIIFDWLSTRHAARNNSLCLTLGYNTAIFCTLLRLRGVPNLINMDGIEWSRAKWGGLAKAWFWMNERAGCWLGNHLIADHPEIRAHLSTRVAPQKITTIPYGAVPVTAADVTLVEALGLQPGTYLTLIARAEPENSILEAVQGFSEKPRGYKLVVLGNYDTENNPYHRAVKAAASDEVCFVGAIYDKATVQALRFFSAAYVHGHQVGGTNPSLVEALGAGNAVLAHDNRFNRWVAGDAAMYFNGAAGFSGAIEQLLGSAEQRALLQKNALARFQQEFTWPHVLAQYETLLENYLPQQNPGLAVAKRI
ncbi:MAG: DUF1972 domain-containing protein [Spongiibacteraceae bacterium]